MNEPQVDMDVLRSFQKQQTSESALFAAMDTTITAGALNPYLSHMVLMQYSDAQTRVSNSLTQRSAITDKITDSGSANMFVSALVPMVANIGSVIPGDGINKNGVSSLRNSTSSVEPFDHVDADELLCCTEFPSSRRSSVSSLSEGQPAFTVVADGKRHNSDASWDIVKRTRSGPISPKPSLQRSGYGDFSQQQSMVVQKITNNTSRTLLHPSDCARKRRSGVANLGVSGDYSVSTDELKTIEMKGRLLTGDEVSYSYVALNAMDGTNGGKGSCTVLYTDHPRPQFRSDFSISEKTLINSSTGLYRTLVGEVPRVLNPSCSSPTGIPEIDRRRDSVDSGTVNDDADSLAPLTPEDESRYKKDGSQSSGVSGKGSLRNNRLPASVLATNSLKDIRYSFSPSFEDRSGMEDSISCTSINTADGMKAKNKTPVPDSEHSSTNCSSIRKELNEISQEVASRKTSNNSIRVCQRKTSVSQVSINTSGRNIPDFAIHIESSQESGVSVCNEPSTATTKGRLNAKKTWASLLARTIGSRQNSNHSLRSASTDSGYKQSFSLDESSPSINDASNTASSPKAVRYSPQPPIIKENENDYYDSPLALCTTVVSIENDRFRKLSSVQQQKPPNTSTNPSKRGSLKRSSLKKRLSTVVNDHVLSKCDERHVTDNNTCAEFDQYQTIEQSPLPGRKVLLPTFFDREEQSSLSISTTSECTTSELSSDNSRGLTPTYRSASCDKQRTTSSLLEEEYVILNHLEKAGEDDDDVFGSGFSSKQNKVGVLFSKSIFCVLNVSGGS